MVAKSILQFGGFIAGAAEQAMAQTPDLVLDFHPDPPNAELRYLYNCR